ncbi:MAG: LysM peptidoglycan-binding domain-containing protein [Bacteroidales bacterium]|nr:LysM peptidoglycan-binding domain-containing protein [Bacteroidales bacterium]
MTKPTAIAIMLLLPMLAMSQTGTVPPPVELSTDKVKIGGDVFYVHIVQPGQTLYSISRAYGVGQSEIVAANPDIYADLKAGQALKIPVKEQVDDGERYIYHIAKRRETIYSIAKRYGISQETLLDLNPAIKDGLKRNQVVVIPRYDTPRPAEPDTLAYAIHEVQRGEGLYGISRRYAVTPRDIELLNRDLLAEGLRPGMQLRIPKPTLQPATLQPSAPAHELPQSDYTYDGSPFNIAMLLPFTQPSSTDLGGDAGAKRRTSATTQSTLEFYEGFLLAMDSMKRSGVSVNLSVYDTKKQPVEVAAIVRGGALQRADLVVGPFFIDELLPLAHYAADAGINLVSPSYNGPTPMPSGTITINQTFREQFAAFVGRLELNPELNYVAVYDAGSTYTSAHRYCDSLLRLKFAQAGIPLHRYAHTMSQNSAVAQDSLSRRMSMQRHNIVIVPSEDEPFVSEILGNIYGVKNQLSLKTTVYGPARWMRMKNIATEYLYNIGLHIYSPFFIDYTKPAVRQFVGDYREMYRAEPSQLSFLGYDLGLYLLGALRTYGAQQLRTFLPMYSSPSLQMNCAFRRADDGCLRNVGQVEVHYLNTNEILSY